MEIGKKTIFIVVGIIILSAIGGTSYFLNKKESDRGNGQGEVVGSTSTSTPEGGNYFHGTLFCGEDIPSEADKAGETQKIGIQWNAPVKVDGIRILKTEFVQSQDYYLVGKVADGEFQGKDLILGTFLLSNENDKSWGLQLNRFIKIDESHYVALSRYSQLITLPLDKGCLAGGITVSQSPLIVPGLEYPENISVPGTRFSLTKEYERMIDSVFFDSKNLKKVDALKPIGDVYTTADATVAGGEEMFLKNGFYIPLPDGTTQVYSLAIDFMKSSDPESDDYSIPDVTWGSGGRNILVYYDNQFFENCGRYGFVTLVPPAKVELSKDLVATGKNKFGDPVYEFKSGSQWLKDYYNNCAQGYYRDTFGAGSYREFLDQRSVFVWVDPFGRMILFSRGVIMRD